MLCSDADHYRRLMYQAQDELKRLRDATVIVECECLDCEELAELRVRDEKATAVVQAWAEVRGHPNARYPVPLVGVLDALARAHQDGGQDQ